MSVFVDQIYIINYNLYNDVKRFERYYLLSYIFYWSFLKESIGTDELISFFIFFFIIKQEKWNFCQITIQSDISQIHVLCVCKVTSTLQTQRTWWISMDT